MTNRTPWNETEIAAGIALYFSMQEKAQSGQPYNKAAMIREAQGEPIPHAKPATGATFPVPYLKARSRGSIEAKLMNITACVEKLGRPELSMAEHGYRPLKNYQAALFTAVQNHVGENRQAVTA